MSEAATISAAGNIARGEVVTAGYAREPDPSNYTLSEDSDCWPMDYAFEIRSKLVSLDQPFEVIGRFNAVARLNQPSPW